MTPSRKFQLARIQWTTAISIAGILAYILVEIFAK
jgi:hypothetical protein